MSKTKLWHRITRLARRGGDRKTTKFTADLVPRIEELLVEADFGVDMTFEFVDRLEKAIRRKRSMREAQVHSMLRQDIMSALELPPSSAREGVADEGVGPLGLRQGPGISVVLLAGVNGSGKTTTAARLAYALQMAGESIVLAAADTFRAGAQEQLQIWANRLGVEFAAGQYGADPASVAFDAVAMARARGAGWVVVDTAGRLHTQSDLMGELAKIDRVLGKCATGAPHERLLVIDSTSGQNAVQQARQFGEILDLTGLVLAKFDASARAGTAVAIVRELGIPVRLLGMGENAADLEVFTPDRYVDRILGPGTTLKGSSGP